MSMNVETGLPYMLSVEEARARILNMFEMLETERKPLLDALGQTLAEDVSSTLDIPPLTNSAMDGYAVRHEAVAGASAANPIELRVVGHLAAGELPGQSVEGANAIRIMTGAPFRRARTPWCHSRRPTSSSARVAASARPRSPRYAC